MTEIDETRDDETVAEDGESMEDATVVRDSSPESTTEAAPPPPPEPTPIAPRPEPKAFVAAPPPEPTPLSQSVAPTPEPEPEAEPESEPEQEPEPEPAAAAPIPEPMREDETRPGTRGSRVVPAPVEPPGTDPSFELGALPNTGTSDDAPYPRERRQGVLGLLPWLLFILALIVGAFVFVQLYLPATEDLERINGELEAARKDAARLQRQVETLEGSQEELAAKVEQRENEVKALQATQDELSERLQKEIERGEVAISQAKGEVVVDLIDKVLFDSGEAELNEKGAAVLRQVGETLLKVPDKIIQVTGHTDAMPISDKLKDQFPTNWELSTHRATNVVRFLEEEVKVPGERLAAVGRSQYDPIANNKYSKGRRRNRRIEVTLIAKKLR